MARIAVIDLVFHWPPKGGSMVHVRELLTRIALHHEVRLFVPYNTRVFPRGVIRRDTGFDVEVIPIPFVKLNAYHLPKLIRERVKAYKPDIVWVTDGWALKPYIINAFEGYRLWHSFFAYEMLCPLSPGKFWLRYPCRRTVLTSPHNCFYHAVALSVRETALRNWSVTTMEMISAAGFNPSYSKIVRRALQKCEFHFVSSSHYKKLLSNLEKTVYVAPAGVDTRRLYPRNIEGDGILMVGRVSDKLKGFAILKEALNILKQRGVSSTLRFTGEGEYGEGIEALGWWDYGELPALYKSAAVVVVPSIWEEPFGLVAVEAMACGIPVIASNIGGLSGIVIHGETGYLVRPGDPVDLANHLEILLAEPALRRNMGEAGRQRVEESFEWDVIVDKHYLPLI